MKTYALGITLLLALTLQGAALGQHHLGGMMSSSEKSPALAALLSLQPLPVDAGSFYAGNWERGIVYTAVEVALFVPAMITLSRNTDGWGHHSYDPYYYADANRRTWTSAERNRFYYLLGGYVLVKVISAFDAGYSVEQRNAAMMLGYNEVTQSVDLSVSIPIGAGYSQNR